MSRLESGKEKETAGRTISRQWSYGTIAPKLNIIKNYACLCSAVACTIGLAYVPLRTLLVTSRQMSSVGLYPILLHHTVSCLSFIYGSTVASWYTYKTTVCHCLLFVLLPIIASTYLQNIALIAAFVIFGIVQGRQRHFLERFCILIFCYVIDHTQKSFSTYRI